MKEVEKVLLRMKELLVLKNDTQLAKFLDIKSLNNHKQRNSIPYSEIIEKAELGKYHLDYIFLGIGKKAPANATLTLGDDKNKFDDVVDSHEVALLLSDLIKYGNKDLYDNIENKIKKIKEVSKS